MSAEGIERLETLAYQFGRSYDSYLVMDLDRQYFWSAGRRAVLGFVRRGRQAVVIGGLIGAEGDREELLTQFMQACRQRGWTACFALVAEGDLPMFDRYGFQSTKIGEDALIHLPGQQWQGKAFEWVRRQCNYCMRYGLVCREIVDGELGRQEELAALSKDFLSRTPHGEGLRYFVGQFDAARLGRRRVFAALADAGRGRAEGFVVCTPFRNGSAWGIEMYRSRADAVRGTIPFLMREVMGVLAAENASEVSLCLMPAAGCGQRRPGDSWLIHSYVRLTHRYLNFILDTPGISHFKTRFRPERQSRYCSVWPKASLRPLHAILSVWGTLKFSLWRALGRGIRRLRVRRARSSLSES